MLQADENGGRSQCRPAPPGGRPRRLTGGIALISLLAIAAVLRLSGLNWDQNQLVHPDERYLVSVADSLRWPVDTAVLMDPDRSALNPFRWPSREGLPGLARSFPYGHFPLYLLTLSARGPQWLAGLVATGPIGRWLEQASAGTATFLTAAQALANYDMLAPVGRVISSAFDLGTVCLVFLVGGHLYGRWAGTAAAAGYAVAVLPVQLSHFCAVDLVLAFCVTASLACSIRFAERGGRLAWNGAGLMAGLAIGSKFTAVILALSLLAAAFIRVRAGVAPGRRNSALGLAGLAGLSALAAFAVTNPYVLLDIQSFVASLAAQAAMVTGRMDAPYTRQYLGTLPYVYQVWQSSQWGLSWPMGALVWGGLVWVVVRTIRGRATSAELVLVSWAVPYFALVGAFVAKFPRYLAPLLPCLFILGAGAAASVWRWLAERRQRRGRALASVALALVGVIAVLWVLAFTGVYRQPHPWIKASYWILQQVPAGSKILTEQWDDALPLALEGIAGRPEQRAYDQQALPLFEPDTSAKLELIAGQLASGDYLILASNRLSTPIQRLQARYPMSSQYYRLLFRGELGYRQVAEFTSYPRLGGWSLPDDHADESLTVYDHPHVRIYANTDRLSAAELTERLGRFLPYDSSSRISQGGGNLSPQRAPSVAQVLTRPEAPSEGWQTADAALLPRRPPGHAQMLPDPARQAAGDPEGTPPGDSASPALQVADPGVADFRWNLLASRSPPLAILTWYLVIAALGFLAWPLLFPLLSGLRDRGFGLARLSGWLLLGWIHWLGVSLGGWQNRTPALAALALLLLPLGALAARRQRAQLKGFWREHIRLMLGEEALFAGAFLAFVGIRLLNPDLWQPFFGGEKFMEFAFVNATLRSTAFPPYDPYFAGGTINYYYYGLYLVGLPIKLTGIVPEVAFNLAIPTLYALTVSALFCVGYSLAPIERLARRTGGLAVLLGAIMGNLQGAWQLLSNAGALRRGGAGITFDYWAASRVIPFTINEFPFWTFLFADLHPHLIAMPIGLLVVGLALNWLRGNGDTAPEEEPVVLRPADSVLRQPPALSLRAQEPVSIEGSESGLRPDQSFTGRPLESRGDGPCVQTCRHPELAALPAGNTDDDRHRQPPAMASANKGEHCGSEPGSPPAGLRLLPGRPPRRQGVPGTLWIARVSLLVLAVGALGPTNTWDLPVYLILLTGAFALEAWRHRRAHWLALGLALSAIVAAGAWVAYLPFYRHYQPAIGSGAGSLLTRFLAPMDQGSPIAPYLGVWGFFLALAVLTTGVEYLRRSGAATSPAPAYEVADYSQVGRARHTGIWRILWLLAVLGAALAVTAAGRPTAALAACPAALAFGLVWRREEAVERSAAFGLGALGLAVVSGIELVYFRDFLAGGEWYRMNTLFKFSVPAWLILALSGSAMLSVVWSRIRAWPWYLRLAPGGALAVLLVAGLAYLPALVYSRIRDRFEGLRPAFGTLDGMAYLATSTYYWPDAEHPINTAADGEAVRWLLDQVTGSPMVAEAPAGTYEVDGHPVGYDYYRAGGLRVASLTGLPTFVGQHQYEQRDAGAVSVQADQGQEFFRTADQGLAQLLIERFGIRYIYVGTLERMLFAASGLAKFDAMASVGALRVAYMNEQVTIYEVIPGAP